MGAVEKEAAEVEAEAMEQAIHLCPPSPKYFRYQRQQPSSEAMPLLSLLGSSLWLGLDYMDKSPLSSHSANWQVLKAHLEVCC